MAQPWAQTKGAGWGSSRTLWGALPELKSELCMGNHATWPGRRRGEAGRHMLGHAPTMFCRAEQSGGGSSAGQRRVDRREEQRCSAVCSLQFDQVSVAGCRMAVLERRHCKEKKSATSAERAGGRPSVARGWDGKAAPPRLRKWFGPPAHADSFQAADRPQAAACVHMFDLRGRVPRRCPAEK